MASTTQVNNIGYAGFATGATQNGEFNQVSFMVGEILAKLSTCTLVQVTAQSGGGLAPVGYVDVKLLVKQATPDGKTKEQPIAPNLPYFRLQGGANAVVIDPVVGDIGIACFASRDISTAKTARQESPPGSGRMFDISDGLYIGGVLNATPTQYIQFTGDGIVVHSPGDVTINAGGNVDITASGDANITASNVNITAQQVTADVTTFTVNGDTVLNGGLSQGVGGSGGTATMIGPLIVTNNVTGAGISLNSHVHGGVQTGGGNTGGPT